MSKKRAALSYWMKEIAPSDDLRTWFSHEPQKWPDFQRKYTHELSTKLDLISRIKKFEKENGTITLIYAAKDTEHNNAVVLKEFLAKQ